MPFLDGGKCLWPLMVFHVFIYLVSKRHMPWEKLWEKYGKFRHFPKILAYRIFLSASSFGFKQKLIILSIEGLEFARGCAWVGGSLTFLSRKNEVWHSAAVIGCPEFSNYLINYILQRQFQTPLYGLCSSCNAGALGGVFLKKRDIAGNACGA